jgi:hypothetical protein
VEPGLYKIGNPDKNSDVLVSANYKLSFDHLRKHLANQNLWILVIDTKGINVWCAAGKGTFGTNELVKRIHKVKLTNFIDHYKIIVPQLGGPGVSAQEVKKQTGLRVYYGPVLAKDIPEYLINNYKATPAMRLMKFSLLDRLVLVPMELSITFKYLLYFSLAVFLIMGLTKEGILFEKAMANGLPFYVAGLTSIIAGAIITPAFLPFIPFRAFSLKGAVTGFIIALIVSYFTEIYSQNFLLMIFLFLFLPAISSLVALQFTGSSTFTNHSGVEKEHKIALPIIAAGIVISALLMGVFKIKELGIL